jgi:hypothetical protein
MTKTNAIIGLVVLVVILLFINFSNFRDSSIPSDYQEMTAWQLLDIKIDYDNQIQALKDNRQEIINFYNAKRGWVNTGTTAIENETKVKEVVEVPVSTNVEWNNLGL